MTRDPLALGNAETGTQASPKAWASLKDWIVWELDDGAGVTVYATRDGLSRHTKGHLQCNVRDLRVLAKLLPAFLAEYDDRQDA